ncbi:MAG: dGTPase [Helicobacteraceae bacterium]|nr:dGTPase [Helicobacteraceae bacterium]
MIDYRKKITLNRELYPFKDITSSCESDRGRIISSGALRRLQKRTQVFALELNASIRTRLTHSMEVAQTARFIAMSILAKLKERGLDTYGLENMENAFISTAEMTSLLHDIGNPPFGHSAEETINQWVENNALNILNDFSATTQESKELKEMLSRDICNYDGNAQAIRVITKLQRLNLSYTQILSVLKYTRGAFEAKPFSEDKLNYLKKKPGFYYSEKDFILKIQETLEVKAGCRFPLTYIMEAADDISYLTADLEDSVEKGILSLKEVYDIIKKECEKENEIYLLDIIEKQYANAIKNEEPYQFNMFFTLTRAKLVTALVYYAVDIYLENHEAIFNGEFNSSLLEYDETSEYFKAIEILQNVSIKYIYKNSTVQTLELQGYAIVNGLLNIYKPLLELSSTNMEKLLKNERVRCFISERLIKRVSSKQIVAYQNDVDKINKEDKEQYQILEWYYRVRLIIDYISGMTDDFAQEEYKILTAIK